MISNKLLLLPTCLSNMRIQLFFVFAVCLCWAKTDDSLIESVLNSDGSPFVTDPASIHNIIDFWMSTRFDVSNQTAMQLTFIILNLKARNMLTYHTINSALEHVNISFSHHNQHYKHLISKYDAKELFNNLTLILDSKDLLKMNNMAKVLNFFSLCPLTYKEGCFVGSATHTFKLIVNTSYDADTKFNLAMRSITDPKKCGATEVQCPKWDPTRVWKPLISGDVSSLKLSSWDMTTNDTKLKDCAKEYLYNTVIDADVSSWEWWYYPLVVLGCIVGLVLICGTCFLACKLYNENNGNSYKPIGG